MKKNIIYILLLSTMLFACKKNEMMPYGSTDNVYLRYLDKDGNQDTTTLSYSFAYNPSLAQDTIWVPIVVTGPRVSHTRQFVLNIVDSMTTAVKGLHYEALKPSYTLPADSGKTRIPLIIKNTDDALASKSVTVGFRTVSGGDFSADLPVALRSKKIIFSNRLEKPAWWIYWESSLGEYGRTKHQLFLISSGTVDLVEFSKPNFFLEIPRSLYYIENFRVFLKDPATWIARNPSKGYVLTKKTDGSNDYDFYSEDAPTKRYTLKYFALVNGYFFIDESGKQIII
ncbi:DUF4843 domain-containing protein [Pedobacter fastidiosus]|uniref:DUF4843 domain-containing protein n=1 Tax=Pedobacter fastidiosus TaxID=2765361 RepID=A0ABR7KUU9_9SPHI|nr:DUF4843 domain-containing protein [Pedobacter fastidiosus]MBC6111885.1 DUF4843 domain-containing protein [Pedobacter fastidiosus]